MRTRYLFVSHLNWLEIDGPWKMSMSLNFLFFNFRLKTMQPKAKVLGKLLDSWAYLYRNDEVSMIQLMKHKKNRMPCSIMFDVVWCQAILIEGVESLLINIDLKKTAQKALEQASENLKRDPYSQRSHSILFVKNKLLAMCSR